MKLEYTTMDPPMKLDSPEFKEHCKNHIKEAVDKIQEIEKRLYTPHEDAMIALDHLEKALQPKTTVRKEICADMQMNDRIVTKPVVCMYDHKQRGYWLEDGFISNREIMQTIGMQQKFERAAEDYQDSLLSPSEKDLAAVGDKIVELGLNKFTTTAENLAGSFVSTAEATRNINNAFVNSKFFWQTHERPKFAVETEIPKAKLTHMRPNIPVSNTLRSYDIYAAMYDRFPKKNSYLGWTFYWLGLKFKNLIRHLMSGKTESNMWWEDSGFKRFVQL